MNRTHLPFDLTRNKAYAILAAAAAVLAAAAFLVLSAFCGSSVHARLDMGNAGKVRVLDPVTVRFDRAVDTSSVKVTITPATAVKLDRRKDRIVIAPATRWEPVTHYTVALGDVKPSGSGSPLKGWKATFTTQDRVGVAGVKVDDQTVSGQGTIRVTSKPVIAFTVPMKPASVGVAVDGQALPASALAWAPDGASVTVTPPNPLPYKAFKLSVQPGGQSAGGDLLTDVAEVTLTPQPVLPANSSSGVGPGFKLKSPVMIVVENSGAARPQTGLQKADIVFEYISEYSISRMTAVYFNNLPGQIGPVRSCRMINPYIGFAFQGLTMCSGGSVGTLHYMFGDGHDIPLVPATINDFDRGNHFYRVDFKAAPHNLYTDGGRAEKLRREWGPPSPPNYWVDPPHPDSGAGAPADAPSVPLHAVSYSYDAGSQTYLRFDHGTPFVDTDTGGQLRVKNVVVMHVPFHDAGWIEDENGGAHSIWYDMLGTGQAEIYSDGKLIRAVWHMGQDAKQPYYSNHTPVWFTDEQGHVVVLNTGLTWIHVVGNGQNS
jgi:hypothetical protein